MRERDDVIYLSYEMMRRRPKKRWTPGVAAYLGAEYTARVKSNDYDYALLEVCSVTHVQVAEAAKIIAGWGKAGLTVDSFKELPPGGVVESLRKP